MNKRILMICYYYPPLVDVGHKRSLSFSKYFKKHGWEPFIVTVKNPDKRFCMVGKKNPPEDINVYYTYSLVNLYGILGKANALIYKLFRLINIKLKRNYLIDFFCIPDIFFGWIFHTTLYCLKLIRSHNINIIYCSCPPYSAAIIGTILKIITKKKLIIDFRDPIPSDVHVWNIPPPPTFRKKIDKIIADWFFKKCDIFLITSMELKEIYVKIYPHLKDKIYVIYNGYESCHKKNISKQKFKNKKFTIIYVGNYYFGYGNPEFFFYALSYLKEKNYINRNNFQFLYYGTDSNKIKNIAKRLDIGDIVLANSFKEYDYIVDHIRKSHFQLLRIARPMISTKLFEGIALNIPFIAPINDGEAAEIIRKYSPSSYIIKEDIQEISKAIIDAKRRYENGEIKENKVNEFLKEFSRESQALKLIKIIEDISKN